MLLKTSKWWSLVARLQETSATPKDPPNTAEPCPWPAPQKGRSDLGGQRAVFVRTDSSKVTSHFWSDVFLFYSRQISFPYEIPFK